jgi:protein-L-isoaspartate O-methyltransferase
MIEILIAGRELGKTLEIGAGCGYQAAILGVLSKQVFAVERIAPLLARARENLKQIRLSHIRLKHADGNLGLPEAAPFDTIILAAAAAAVPQTLLAQLAPGGRLVMPLGTTDQVISLVERTERDLSKPASMRCVSCRCCRGWNERHAPDSGFDAAADSPAAPATRRRRWWIAARRPRKSPSWRCRRHWLQAMQAADTTSSRKARRSTASRSITAWITRTWRRGTTSKTST